MRKFLSGIILLFGFFAITKASAFGEPLKFNNNLKNKDKGNPWGNNTGEIIETIFRNLNISNGIGIVSVNDFGISSSNMFRFRIEDPNESGYFFIGGCLINDIIDEDRFIINRYRQYSPNLSLNSYSFGIGSYAFSKLQDNISINMELGLSFCNSTINLNQEQIDNDYEGYWIAVGLNEKISDQLKFHLELTLISPFSTDVVKEKLPNQQKNLLSIIEFGYQIMLFNR